MSEDVAGRRGRKTWPESVVGRRGRKAWSEGVAERRGWKTCLPSRGLSQVIELMIKYFGQTGAGDRVRELSRSSE